MFPFIRPMDLRHNVNWFESDNGASVRALPADLQLPSFGLGENQSPVVAVTTSDPVACVEIAFCDDHDLQFSVARIPNQVEPPVKGQCYPDA